MDAASAPTSAVTLPPPGAGCLAAAPSKNPRIVAEASYIIHFRSPTRHLPSSILDHSFPPNIMLHPFGRQIQRRKRLVRPLSLLRLYKLRLARPNGNDAL